MKNIAQMLAFALAICTMVVLMHMSIKPAQQPVIIYQTPAKSTELPRKPVKFKMYEGGCFDAKQAHGIGGKFILRCI